MGEKNDTICSYLCRPDIFADFINGSVYGGKQVILPEELETLRYTGKEEHSDRNGKNVQKLRNRDVAKLRTRNNQYAILAIENQDELHYYMPFRCMEYETEDYARQIRRLKKAHERTKDLDSGAEFLSGIRKTDRLKPVVTFVFYHGKGSWDACRELHDMIDFSGENEILKEYTSNYRANIISLKDVDENCFCTSLREVIGMMRRRDDSERMYRFYKENEERFRNIDEDTFDTISVMTDRKNLVKYKETNRKKEGTVDMCRAFDELEKQWYRDGEIAGMQTGKMEGRQEGEQIFALLARKLLEAGRIEDLRIASVNEENRKALYAEYGLECVSAT